MRDGRYSGVVVEAEADPLSVAQHAQTFRPGVRLPTVVICTLITALASVVGTYIATRSSPVDCASRGDLQKVSGDVADINRTLTALLVTVNANADREANHFAITNGLLSARK